VEDSKRDDWGAPLPGIVELRSGFIYDCPDCAETNIVEAVPCNFEDHPHYPEVSLPESVSKSFIAAEDDVEFDVKGEWVAMPETAICKGCKKEWRTLDSHD